MASRMERYYKPESKTKRRTVANQELYRKIYDTSEYSNIEGIATIEKANEIDITKVKNMLKNREEYQRQRDLRSLIHKEEPKVQHIETTPNYEEDNRIYDLSDILEKAKEEKKEPTEKYRNLGDTNYNILKSLKIRSEKHVDEEIDKTMTNTSVLRGLNDNDLSLDLLGDLKSNTVTIANNSEAIQQLLEQAKAEERKKIEAERKVELDKSFFTSSLGFGSEDFEEIRKKTKNKKGNIIKKIGLIISLIMIAIGIIVLVYTLIK